MFIVWIYDFRCYAHNINGPNNDACVNFTKISCIEMISPSYFSTMTDDEITKAHK